MTTAWYKVLTSLEPDYSTLCNMNENGPTIRAELSQKDKHWCITLVEDWGQDIDILENNSYNLDKTVQWVDETLINWPNCKRMAWDQWYFDSKHNAELFITLFYIHKE